MPTPLAILGPWPTPQQPTLQGMKKYLGSGLVKGIGPVNAGRIVDAFGEATFDVIDADAGRLTEVPGIGPIRAGRIAATWAEQRHIREVMAALQGYGISTSLAVRIYKKFGDDSGRVVSQDPYRLAREVWGIGFKTADKIAQAVGIAPDAPERLQAGVLHALGQAADEGHTLLPEDRLLVLAAELLGAEAGGVRVVLTEPVAVLTGGPGTGKTHTLRAVLLLAGAKKLRCVLAAPTGRAAKRMQEATGWPAGTLHRVLELRPGGQAGHTVDRPLEADLVVVDETSMLDVLLANQLAKAVAPGAHLLLVGDPDQLPSVGAGDVLADLLRSERFPVTRLEHVFRQGAGSGIARNARRVNAGEMPRFGGDITDCFFLPAEDPSAASRTVVDLVAERLPRRYG